MERKIEALSKHTVVAGAGRTGRYIVEELVHAKSHFVVIDTDEAKLEKINQELGGQLLYIVGDATDDHVLTAAGIERATGVITALPDDRDNLFVTLSVRSVNPKTRIVAKVVEIENEGKIVRAGADSTVSPHRIGGLRLVSELLRPRVTEFLDRMLRARKDLQFDEIEVPEASPFAGKTLREMPIRAETNLLVVALHQPGDQYIYNPGPDVAVEGGFGLIVMGQRQDVVKLRAMMIGSA
jgi:voltage-gated potassium channel